jgi:regulator of sigma D
MLDNCKNAKERWGGVSEIIDRWLEERQQMLIQYCALSGLDASGSEQGLSDSERSEKLGSFCQILMDYASAGHFEIYDQLIKEGRDFDDKNALKEASKIYKVLDATTEKLLDFNDKYLETDDLSSLSEDLSQLGETLEIRFSSEDKLIDVLHTAHKDLVTQ